MSATVKYSSSSFDAAAAAACVQDNECGAFGKHLEIMPIALLLLLPLYCSIYRRVVLAGYHSIQGNYRPARIITRKAP